MPASLRQRPNSRRVPSPDQTCAKMSHTSISIKTKNVNNISIVTNSKLNKLTVLLIKILQARKENWKGGSSGGGSFNIDQKMGRGKKIARWGPTWDQKNDGSKILKQQEFSKISTKSK